MHFKQPPVTVSLYYCPETLNYNRGICPETLNLLAKFKIHLKARIVNISFLSDLAEAGLHLSLILPLVVSLLVNNKFTHMLSKKLTIKKTIQNC